MERCIWFAFLELSGANAYAKIAMIRHRIKNQKLKTPQKFFLNFWSATLDNDAELFTSQS
ncbi:hypothetical protein SCB49_02919 [unidentified eubacterium SCB49]|nr:hypothetical protein SCB49_02919 [unidentified eubacterium SCB49]